MGGGDGPAGRDAARGLVVLAILALLLLAGRLAVRLLLPGGEMRP